MSKYLSAAAVIFRPTVNGKTEDYGSLFRSPVVTDIGAHLSPEESAQLVKMNQQSGFLLGLCLSLPTLFFVIAVPVYKSPYSLLALVVFELAVVLFGFFWGQRKQKIFWASTKYAQSIGIEAESLHLYGFGSERT